MADSASHYWIGTTRPDGRPHLAGVGIVWDDGKFYLSTGAGTQKGKNLAHDPRCTVSIAAPGIDIVAEGEAKIIRDEGELRRIATDLFGGWGPQVRDGAFWHEYSAPSAGPPPWDVYEITPTAVYRGCVGGAARRHPLEAVTASRRPQVRTLDAGTVRPDRLKQSRSWSPIPTRA